MSASNFISLPVDQSQHRSLNEGGIKVNTSKPRGKSHVLQPLPVMGGLTGHANFLSGCRDSTVTHTWASQYIRYWPMHTYYWSRYLLSTLLKGKLRVVVLEGKDFMVPSSCPNFPNLSDWDYYSSWNTLRLLLLWAFKVYELKWLSSKW